MIDDVFLHKDDIPEFIPEITPVSMLDVDRMPPMEMMQQMSDPCPLCKGFTMLVGDYVCWGTCSICYGSGSDMIRRLE